MNVHRGESGDINIPFSISTSKEIRIFSPKYYTTAALKINFLVWFPISLFACLCPHTLPTRKRNEENLVVPDCVENFPWAIYYAPVREKEGGLYR